MPVAADVRRPRRTTRSVAARWRWNTLAQLAADHQAHDLVLGQLRRRAHRDEPAVAQDGHPVGEAQDLAQAVADVDDGHALVAQAADEREQALDLLVGQRRGGLVEGQDAHRAT